MKAYSIIRGFFGVRHWKRISGYGGITLLAPTYDADLLTEAGPALRRCVLSGMPEEIRVLYADPRIPEILSEHGIPYVFQEMRPRDLERLRCYLMLTAKHYGSLRVPAVKILDLDRLFGGQPRRMAENDLFPTTDLIYEMVLTWE